MIGAQWHAEADGNCIHLLMLQQEADMARTRQWRAHVQAIDFRRVADLP
jgi:hypothetical protein